jgi:hypothetical protein
MVVPFVAPLATEVGSTCPGATGTGHPPTCVPGYGRGSRSSLAVFTVTPALTIYALVASARGLLFDTSLISKKTILYLLRTPCKAALVPVGEQCPAQAREIVA